MVDTYPLPIARIEDIHASLAGGIFIKARLFQREYKNMPLSTPWRFFTRSINYHLVCHKPHPCSNVLWRSSYIAYLECASTYIDDILFSGWTRDEHLRNLEAVLTRLASSSSERNVSSCCPVWSIWGSRSPQPVYTQHQRYPETSRPNWFIAPVKWAWNHEHFDKVKSLLTRETCINVTSWWWKYSTQPHLRSPHVRSASGPLTIQFW